MSLTSRAWVVLAFVLAILGAYLTGHTNGVESGSARVKQAWDIAEKNTAITRAKRIEDNRKTEQALQIAADLERKNRDAENKLLNVRLDNALRELQSRPPRPSRSPASDVPSAARAAPEVRGCTGAELYRDDAEFLTRKSDLAQRIRADRDACYSQYEATRKKLNEIVAP